MEVISVNSVNSIVRDWSTSVIELIFPVDPSDSLSQVLSRADNGVSLARLVRLKSLKQSKYVGG